MKKTTTLIVLLLAFSSLCSYGQNVISYTYDSAGNRTSRTSGSSNVAQDSQLSAESLAAVAAKHLTGFKSENTNRQARMLWDPINNTSVFQTLAFLGNRHNLVTRQPAEKEETKSKPSIQRKPQED